jgi:two-component system response regulator
MKVELADVKREGDRTILLVEDNLDDVDLTKRAFRLNRVVNELAIARDGLEALDYLFCRGKYADREPTLPCVVLLDLRLPRIDGLEVLQRIRADERTKVVPVVVLTTSKEQQDLVTAYRNGANSYVQKPVNFEEFVTAVNQLGLYWSKLNEPPPDSRG